MRTVRLACALLASLAVVLPTQAADDLIERLATCQASWLEWKDDPVRTRTLAETFSAAFVLKPNSTTWVPRSRVLVVGLPVIQAFPESVGMGVGFSVVVEATFDDTRNHLEKAAGKKLSQCETGEGMRSCALEIADKRTLMVMAGDDGKAKKALLGCYYYYEK